MIIAGVAGEASLKVTLSYDVAARPLRTQVTVTGHAVPDDPGHTYRYLDAPGEWAGGDDPR